MGNVEKKQATTEDQSSRDRQMREKEQNEDDRIEIEETALSKNLAESMIKSSIEGQNDTLKKAVEVIQNQNGSLHSILFCLKKIKIIFFY